MTGGGERPIPNSTSSTVTVIGKWSRNPGSESDESRVDAVPDRGLQLQLKHFLDLFAELSMKVDASLYSVGK